MSDVLGPDSFGGVFLFLGCAFLAVAFALTALLGLARRRAAWAIPGFVLAAANLFVACWAWTVLNSPMGNLEMDGWDIDIFAIPLRAFGTEFDWADDLLFPWAIACAFVFWLLRRSLKPAA